MALCVVGRGGELLPLVKIRQLNLFACLLTGNGPQEIVHTLGGVKHLGCLRYLVLQYIRDTENCSRVMKPKCGVTSVKVGG